MDAKHRRTSLLLTALVAAALAVVSTPASAGSAVPDVRVKGNRLLDAAGNEFILTGVNRSGLEYACAQGWGFFDGPSDAASIAVMATWQVNAVRVPLNEACWLGINIPNPAYGGENYRSQVEGYVDRLQAAGMVVILDLHWSAPGTQTPLSLDEMANADHSLDFWTSVAERFENRPGVIFDLFNEPHDIPWACWRDGCIMPEGWFAVGMQDLIDTVRATGAENPVLINANNWGGDLSGWLANKPVDPAKQMIAGVHLYNFSTCINPTCWDSTIGAVAERYPVVTGEVGETTCAHSFVDQYFAWADPLGISYLAWTWNDWAGCNGPALLLDYGGTPSGYGVGVRDHFTLRVSIGDVTAAEPASGKAKAFLPLTLSRAVGYPVTIRFTTRGTTATPGLDFKQGKGQVTILQGSTSAQVRVGLYADDLVEGYETFTVRLASASVLRGDTIGAVTIDDADD